MSADIDQKRLRDRRNRIHMKVRNGTLKVGHCFRCLGEHPLGTQEQLYCPLSAEYTGYPWAQPDSLEEW